MSDDYCQPTPVPTCLEKIIIAATVLLSIFIVPILDKWEAEAKK